MRVLVAAFIFEEMISEGWKIRVVECIKGVPPKSKIVSITMDKTAEWIELIVEHESFAEVDTAKKIPAISVLYEKG